MKLEEQTAPEYSCSSDYQRPVAGAVSITKSFGNSHSNLDSWIKVTITNPNKL